MYAKRKNILCISSMFIIMSIYCKKTLNEARGRILGKINCGVRVMFLYEHVLMFSFYLHYFCMQIKNVALALKRAFR